ncbi:MAG: TIR domain-containing protein [Clostridiales bacterium]|nr:TIR domain-containing protein [Clostridiales bacterium]
MEIFNDIVREDNKNPEAYWGIVLSKYGIEYVEDPSTLERIPTCHRLNNQSVLQDVDYKKALEYSDGIASRIYEREAKKINILQKKILEISQKEKPYDIFICYKESDSFGQRTEESVLSQDIYDKLTNKGYRVFFSKISLEDKLGEKYEPYIFAALHSAKIMLVIGCKEENINAPWVKNEWKRYLLLSKNDKSKTLIPCYKNMNPSALPAEMSLLQAQDLGKLGALQDLERGIDKILKPGVSENNTQVRYSNSNSAVNSKLIRAFQLIEDKDYFKAEELLNNVLENEVNCAKAYVGLLLCDLKLTQEEDLKSAPVPYKQNKNYQRALNAADESYKKILSDYHAEAINNHIKAHDLDDRYERCEQELLNPAENTNYLKLAEVFSELNQLTGGWKDSERLYNECIQKNKEAEIQRKKYLSDTKEQNHILRQRVIVHKDFVVGLRENGTVVIAGKGKEQINKTISTWRDIVYINSNLDGSLIAGLNSRGEFVCNINHFTSIMSKYTYKKVFPGYACGSGIRTDGTVFGTTGTTSTELFKGVIIEDIRVLSNGKIIALDINGKIRSTYSYMENKLKKFNSSYHCMRYYSDDVYAINECREVETTKTKSASEQFVNLSRIELFSGNLFGIDDKGRVISSNLIASRPHLVRKFGDTQRGKDYYYDWCNNLLDFAVCEDVIYGIKFNGEVVYSEKQTIKVDNEAYIQTRIIRSDLYKNAIAVFFASNTLVVLLKDGRAVTNNKDIDLSTWKLFEDINKLTENNEEKRANAVKYGNTLISEDTVLLQESKELKEADSLLDEIGTMLESSQSMGFDNDDYVKMLYQVIAGCKEVAKELKNYKRVNTDSQTKKVNALIEKAESILKTRGRAYEKTCPKCGNLLRQGKRFCSQCGYKLSDLELMQ